MSTRAPLRERAIELALQAGEAIMQVYALDFEVERKDDDSPITQADRAAHTIIVQGLRADDADTPVLSEESAEVAWEVRRHWRRYWLVDPLDGTREFVKRNGEFTVNIALIEDGEPTMAVIYAPAIHYLAHADREAGAFVRDDGRDIAVSSRRPAPTPPRVAASRSHRDARTQAVLERIGPCELLGLGSSLKFCRIAEGRADLYPRFGPTSEWDTAAGQCIVEAAGGRVLCTDGTPLRYNATSSLLNPDFLALGDPDLPWRDWIAQ
ncbi:MAG TPA: 3'(2'),5'-bisphosphate nucleotidase CysQ [Xanthomonadaceae bacterium]|nr:3'(2'),5'-bisphosphate nucleotidase CysQ [Xanthomonadaceae bacterium]